MNNNDRKLIWLLIMTLTGVYVLLMPIPLAVLAMGLSVVAGIKALNG